MREIVFDVELKNFQNDVRKSCHDYSKRHLVVIASRQIGKSFTLRLVCMEWLLSQNCEIGYVTLTNRLGKKFFNEISQTLPKEVIKKADATDLTIETTNGSIISFLSIEGIDKVRGLTFTHLIIDECAFAKEVTPDGQNVWKNILSATLDAKGKKCVFISTPWDKKGLFYESYQKCNNPEYPNWQLIKCTIYDDETKTEDFINEKRKEIGEKAFRQEYLCEFVDGGSSYFVGYYELFGLDKYERGKEKTWIGIDFSDTGIDDTVVTEENESGHIKQYLITGTRDEKYKKIADIINENENLVTCYAEKNSMGGVMTNEIRKLVKPHLRKRIEEFSTTAQSKDELVKALAKDIEGGRLLFEKKNVLLLEQLGVFVATINPRTKNVRYAAMDGHHDDCVMSLGLAHIARCKNVERKIIISVL